MYQWAAQISAYQWVARLWKETSTACLQLCLKWTLAVLCYSARTCNDIVTCCHAGEMNKFSVIWSLFSCAYLTFIMRCTLYQIWALNNLNVNICHVRKMTTACLTLWLIWIMLNLCGQVLLTTLLRSSNSVPAVKLHGLFLFYWVYLVWPLYTFEPIEGPIHLNWIVELSARPSPWAYLSTERIEVVDKASNHGLPTERKYVVVNQATHRILSISGKHWKCVLSQASKIVNFER